MDQRKSLKESKLALVLLGITLISGIAGVIPKEDGFVSSLTVAGYMLASLLHAQRALDEASHKLLKTVYVVLAVVSAIICVVGAIIGNNFGIMVVLDAIGGIGSLLLLIFMHQRLFKFVETCSDKVFYITLALCIFVAPSIFFMLAGVISFILSMVIVVAVIFLVLKGAPDMMMDLGKPKGPQFKTVYVDADGKEHDTAYSRDVANEKIAERD